MTYAHRRDYGTRELGHFGLGLKAASLSQASTLIVWSRAWGCTAVGRLINRDSVGKDHKVAVLRSEQAAEQLDSCRVGFPTTTGTIVEWRDVGTFLTSSDRNEQTTWLEETLEEIRTHLGIVLHRILAAERVHVLIDVFDVDRDEAGVPRSVLPVDPFGYRRSPNSDYPRELHVELPGRDKPIVAQAHIWPPKSSQPEYRLAGEPGREHQGFYFYRHDRLLQIGGWNGVVNDRPEYEFGRVAIDIDEGLQRYLTINPEKSGLTLDSTLSHAIENAVFADSSGTFRDYLDALLDGSRQARSRRRRPITVVEPRSGLPADVVMAFDESLEFLTTAKPVDIRWRTLPAGTFFGLDRERRELHLNARYRAALVGHHSLDPSDAPVVKTLLYLLVSELFEGSYAGARDKAKEDAWQNVLSAALQEQINQLEARQGNRDE